MEENQNGNITQMPDILKDGNTFEQEAIKKEHAAILGKWLWILFWLIIPTVIVGILGNESIVGQDSPVYRFGTMLSVVVGIVYGVVLLQMKGVEEKYRLAGLLSIASVVLSILLEIIHFEHPILVLLTGVPAIALSLAAKYYEFYGHVAVLQDFDPEFSQKWKILWKWNCIIVVGMIVSTLLALFVLFLAALLILAFAIAAVFIAIVELVYLYQMAKLFQQYA